MQLITNQVTRLANGNEGRLNFAPTMDMFIDECEKRANFHERNKEYDRTAGNQARCGKKGTVAFAGGMTWKQAVKAARFGWSDEAKHLNEMYRGLQTDGFKSSRPVVELDVSGGYVDMGAYMAGEPECMAELYPQQQPGLVTVVVEGGYNSGVRAETVRDRGLGIIAAFRTLKAQSYRLDLWACISTISSSTQHELLVRVSDSRYPEPDDRVLFFLAHAALLRRFYFAWCEGDHDGMLKRASNIGYGSAVWKSDHQPSETAQSYITQNTKTMLYLPVLNRIDNGRDWRSFYSEYSELIRSA